MRRSMLLTVALGLALTGFQLPAQESLPDIGSSAGELLTPAQEEEYGAMLLAQLRHYDLILEDPLIDSWLDSLGARLGASSDRPSQPFTFFMLRDRQINAFASLGGYIGTNAGLVLAAEREDEVAGVLSHEIAHVTQQHVLRGAERAQRDQLPILLGMLGAIVAAQSTGGTSAGEATQAVIMSAMGLAQQRQINYTRSNEHEADRIGLQTLSRAGYDPIAMADFFTVMQARSRTNAAGSYDVPDYLMTHPVTTTRISEAKEGATRLLANGKRFQALSIATDNPLLPDGLTLQPLDAVGTGYFDLAKERLRVLSADSPFAAVREYEQIAGRSALTQAQRYGLAVAHLRAGQPTTAATALRTLHADRPDDLWIELALAEAESRSSQRSVADARFDRLVQKFPRNRAIVLTYASTLLERNTVPFGKRAQEILRPIAGQSTDDPDFQRSFARASEIAGEPIRAGEAYAEAAFLSGRAEQALVQLNVLKNRPEVDYYARARIEARIARIMPTVLELHRLGIHDDVLNRRR